MKKLKSFLLVFALTAAFCSIANARASFQFFYDNLDPYGEWIQTANYGYVWHPAGVDEDWAPYTDGYWAYTDGGWTWVSYEDFGGITYHYGRWTRIEDNGWCWVPDYEWAPAWVSWRSSDDYVGWAPLPPECHFRHGVGISFWVDSTYDIGPGYYNFCAYRDFGSPALRPVIIDRGRNVTIIGNTTNITNITVNKSRNIVFNGGPNFALVARKTARPIQTLKLVQQSDVNAFKGAGGGTHSRVQGNQLVVLAPQVGPAQGNVKPQHVGKTLQKVNVDTGWSKVQDPQVKQQIQAKFKKDAKGLTPEKAPAKPVAASDLKIVSDKIKATPPATLTDTTKVPKGKKGATQIPTPAVTEQSTGKPDEQTIAATPAPKPKGGKGKKNPAELQPFNAPSDQTATSIEATPTPGKKNKIPKVATPNPEAEQLRLEKQQQQKIQTDEVKQHKLELQQEHQQQQLEHSVKVKPTPKPVVQQIQAPKSVQQSHEKDKGKDKKKKKDEQDQQSQ